MLSWLKILNTLKQATDRRPFKDKDSILTGCRIILRIIKRILNPICTTTLLHFLPLALDQMMVDIVWPACLFTNTYACLPHYKVAWLVVFFFFFVFIKCFSVYHFVFSLRQLSMRVCVQVVA